MTSVWFVAALLPMIASQILRLHQPDAASWIFWDYAGRLCALGVLAAIPAARAVAFRREARRLPLWKIALWIAGIVLLCIGLIGLGRMINADFLMTLLGGYPPGAGRLQRGDHLSTLCSAHASASSGRWPSPRSGNVAPLRRLSLVDWLGKYDRRFHHGRALHALLSAIRSSMADDAGALSHRSILLRVSAPARRMSQIGLRPARFIERRLFSGRTSAARSFACARLP